MTVRVLIADDSKPVREGLADLIGDHPELDVIGKVADGEAAVAFVKDHNPDVIVMDYSMPHGGVKATQEILSVCPDAKVIALSAFDDESTSSAMLGAGAVRYLVKGVVSLNLVETILDVMGDGSEGASPVT